MASKRQPPGQKNDIRGSTRGVINLPDRPDRPNPFGVQWSERVWDPVRGREVRRRKSEYFPTAELRDRRAARLRDDKRAGLLRTLNRPEVDAWLAFKAAIGDTPWQNVVAGWRAHEMGLGVMESARTVSAHVKVYLREMEERRDAGAITPNWHRHQKHKLGLFAEKFGPLALNAVHPDDIRAWLASLGLGTAGTYNNYRKIIGAFYAHAVYARLLPENPVERVAAKDEIDEEAGILTVPQLARLLHTARTYTDEAGQKPFACCLRRLALEAFAGVRFSSACRLAAEDVNMADRGIRHPSKSIKTRKRHYIDGYPEVLWKWLSIAPDDSLLTERFYMRLKSSLFKVAGVPHPHNCLRHSFATYHVASRSNPGLTAYLLCHRNQQKLWDHYKGNATSAEGRRWEQLTPQRAERIAGEPAGVAEADPRPRDGQAPVARPPDTSPARGDG